MNSKWILFALLFSVAVNIAVVATLFYFQQQDTSKRMQVNIERFDELSDHNVLWFHSSELPSYTSAKIDSLRMLYHQELEHLENKINRSRENIVEILLAEPIDRARLEEAINHLAQGQSEVERLTINHLITLKPLMPQEEWRPFLNDLKPHRTIRTKIIKIGDDTSSRFLDETVMHILNMEDKDLLIETNKIDTNQTRSTR